MTGDSSPVNSLDESTSLILFWALLALFLGGVVGVGMGMTFLGVPIGGRSGRVLSNKNIKIFYVIIFYVIKKIFLLVPFDHFMRVYYVIKFLHFYEKNTYTQKIELYLYHFFQIFLAHHIVRAEKI